MEIGNGRFCGEDLVGKGIDGGHFGLVPPKQKSLQDDAQSIEHHIGHLRRHRKLNTQGRQNAVAVAQGHGEQLQYIEPPEPQVDFEDFQSPFLGNAEAFQQGDAAAAAIHHSKVRKPDAIPSGNGDGSKQNA